MENVAQTSALRPRLATSPSYGAVDVRLGLGSGRFADPWASLNGTNDPAPLRTSRTEWVRIEGHAVLQYEELALRLVQRQFGPRGTSRRCDPAYRSVVRVLDDVRLANLIGAVVYVGNRRAVLP